MSRKSQIIIGIVLLVVIIAFVLIRQLKRKSDAKKIAQKITDPGTGTGTPEDLVYSNAFDPNYWKKVKGGLSVWTYDSTVKEVYKLRSWIGRLYGSSDEESILSWFQKAPSKAHISRVTDIYIQIYSRNLFDDLKTIDYSILGIFGDDPVMPKIQNVINAKPDYI